MSPFETLLKEALPAVTPFAFGIAKHFAEDIEAEVAKEAATGLYGLVKRKLHSFSVEQPGIDKHLTLLSQHLDVAHKAKLTQLLPDFASEDEGLYAPA